MDDSRNGHSALTKFPMPEQDDAELTSLVADMLDLVEENINITTIQWTGNDNLNQTHVMTRSIASLSESVPKLRNIEDVFQVNVHQDAVNVEATSAQDQFPSQGIAAGPEFIMHTDNVAATDELDNQNNPESRQFTVKADETQTTCLRNTSCPEFFHLSQGYAADKGTDAKCARSWQFKSENSNRSSLSAPEELVELEVIHPASISSIFRCASDTSTLETLEEDNAVDFQYIEETEDDRVKIVTRLAQRPCFDRWILYDVNSLPFVGSLVEADPEFDSDVAEEPTTELINRGALTNSARMSNSYPYFHVPALPNFTATLSHYVDPITTFQPQQIPPMHSDSDSDDDDFELNEEQAAMQGLIVQGSDPDIDWNDFNGFMPAGFDEDLDIFVAGDEEGFEDMEDDPENPEADQIGNGEAVPVPTQMLQIRDSMERLGSNQAVAGTPGSVTPEDIQTRISTSEGFHPIIRALRRRHIPLRFEMRLAEVRQFYTLSFYSTESGLPELPESLFDAEAVVEDSWLLAYIARVWSAQEEIRSVVHATDNSGTSDDCSADPLQRNSSRSMNIARPVDLENIPSTSQASSTNPISNNNVLIFEAEDGQRVSTGIISVMRTEAIEIPQELIMSTSTSAFCSSDIQQDNNEIQIVLNDVEAEQSPGLSIATIRAQIFLNIPIPHDFNSSLGGHHSGVSFGAASLNLRHEDNIVNRAAHSINVDDDQFPYASAYSDSNSSGMDATVVNLGWTSPSYSFDNADADDEQDSDDMQDEGSNTQAQWQFRLPIPRRNESTSSTSSGNVGEDPYASNISSSSSSATSTSLSIRQQSSSSSSSSTNDGQIIIDDNMSAAEASGSAIAGSSSSSPSKPHRADVAFSTKFYRLRPRAYDGHRYVVSAFGVCGRKLAERVLPSWFPKYAERLEQMLNQYVDIRDATTYEVIRMGSSQSESPRRVSPKQMKNINSGQSIELPSTISNNIEPIMAIIDTDKTDLDGSRTVASTCQCEIGTQTEHSPTSATTEPENSVTLAKDSEGLRKDEDDDTEVDQNEDSDNTKCKTVFSHFIRILSCRSRKKSVDFQAGQP